ncbi:MAG TPA: diacylglycerol kinase family protein [Chitinophagaceae bacterium]
MEKNTQSNFSIRARAGSFRFAWEGVLAFFKTQHNAIIHLLMTIIVIALAIAFNVSNNEAAMLALATGFVWVSEIFNTAIEKMMDHLSPEKQPAVKYIKDVAAAAVLFSAITAVAVGLIIFLPKLI